jgi:hypothetical protein
VVREPSGANDAPVTEVGDVAHGPRGGGRATGHTRPQKADAGDNAVSYRGDPLYLGSEVRQRLLQLLNAAQKCLPSTVDSGSRKARQVMPFDLGVVELDPAVEVPAVECRVRRQPDLLVLLRYLPPSIPSVR